MPAASEARFVRQDDALIFDGVLDRRAAEALWPQLAKAGGVRRIVLQQVSAVDSAGLALLAELAARLRAAGGEVRIEGEPAGFADLRAAYRLNPGLDYPA